MRHTDKAVLYYCSIAIIIPLIITMLLFKMDDPYGLKLLVFLIAYVVLKPKPIKQFSCIDVVLCLLWIYDMRICFTGMNLLPGWHEIYSSTLCFCGYILLRKIFDYSRSTQLFLYSTGLLAGIVLSLSILSFFIFKQSVEITGFTDSYPFRFLFRPLGYTTNAWSAILIPILGLISIGCYYTSEKISRQWPFLLFLCMTIFTILLSFSRGAYIALGVYILAFLLFVKLPKEKIKLIACSLLIGGLTWFSFPKETVTTLQMNKTISQQQSNWGRVSATQIGWDVFQQKIGCGAGTGNYTLAVDKKLNQDSTRTYTSYAPNFIVQLLVEKGIIGIFLYVFLIIGIAIKLWQRRKNMVSMIVGCTLIAVLVKELTLSVMLSTPVVILLCYSLLALLQRKEDMLESEKISTTDNKIKYIVWGICCLCYICFEFVFIRHTYDENSSSKSLSAFKEGNCQEAIRFMEQTSLQVPYLINRGILYMECYSRNPQTVYLQNAESVLEEAQRLNPEDIHIDYLLIRLLIRRGADTHAYIRMKRMAETYPNNALFQFDLYQLLYTMDKKKMASASLENAIYLAPSILNMESMKKLEQTDSAFFHSVVANLVAKRPVSDDSPATFARYGYITYYNGEIDKAEESLSYAISVLPNLFTPWYLLGEIYTDKQEEEKAALCFKRYRLLTRGAFNPNLASPSVGERDTLFKGDPFINYAMKFKSWYGSNLYVLN